MARFRKVDPRIWNDEKFRRLTDRGKLSFMFLLTHPQLTALGAMRATLDGLAAELGWTLEGFREAFGEALREGMVEAFPEASFVCLPKYLKYNAPESPNVVKSWRAWAEMLPECDGKTALLQRAQSYCESRSKEYAKAFREAFPEAFGKAFPEALPKASRKALANHEPEPEPEQELEEPDRTGGRILSKKRSEGRAGRGKALKSLPSDLSNPAPLIAWFHQYGADAGLDATDLREVLATASRIFSDKSIAKPVALMNSVIQSRDWSSNEARHYADADRVLKLHAERFATPTAKGGRHINAPSSEGTPSGTWEKAQRLSRTNAPIGDGSTDEKLHRLSVRSDGPQSLAEILPQVPSVKDAQKVNGTASLKP